ncbi:MAG: alcohol dehydrogenase catalytic domain-containing protein, partial [Thermoguttaceae bacterium]
MIAATYTQGGAFRVEEVPLPEIADDELLVEVKASSICGTDLRIVRNGHRKLRDGQRVVLGHEFAGVVAEAGRRTAGFPEGMRVGVAPNMGCGRCGMCARALPNMCPDYSAFGITLDGAHARYVRVPHAALAQGSVVPLPDTLPFRHACLLEPLSCVVNASRAVRMEAGETAVVFGAGPIGLMHMMLAALCGASKLICADMRPERLKLAAVLGATSVVDPSREDVREHVMAATGGRGADVVITACSVAAVQEQDVAGSASGIGH